MTRPHASPAAHRQQAVEREPLLRARRSRSTSDGPSTATSIAPSPSHLAMRTPTSDAIDAHRGAELGEHRDGLVVTVEIGEAGEAGEVDERKGPGHSHAASLTRHRPAIPVQPSAGLGDLDHVAVRVPVAGGAPPRLRLRTVHDLRAGRDRALVRGVEVVDPKLTCAGSSPTRPSRRRARSGGTGPPTTSRRAAPLVHRSSPSWSEGWRSSPNPSR